MVARSLSASFLSILLAASLFLPLPASALAEEDQSHSEDIVESSRSDEANDSNLDETNVLLDCVAPGGDGDALRQVPAEGDEAIVAQNDKLVPMEGDTPFSPFIEGALVDITREEAISLYLDEESDGFNAQYLSSSHFESILRYALNFFGWEYVWGGKSPSTSFDCSGLVSHVYGHVLGASMYTNASGIYTNYCSYVNPSDARPGDLVFWRGTYGNDLSMISHVGIYCGNDIVYAAGDPIGFYSVHATRNIQGNPAEYFFGRVKSVDDGYVATATPVSQRYELVFDNSFYCVNNPSASRYVNDASFGLSHFLNNGMKNGWSGSVVFDPVYYRNMYADLRAAFGSDMRKYYDHFISNGCSEGRQGSEEFSLAYYKSHYPDLRAAFGNDNKAYLLHFVNQGMREGRSCNDSFIALNYRNHYPDLQAIYVDKMGAYYGHYLLNGKQEGRTGLDSSVNGTAVINGTDYSSVYDYSQYVSANPDVLKAYHGDPIEVIRHFIYTGMSEGRRASASFDVASYYNANTDVRAAFGTDTRALAMHYLYNGRFEGRACADVPDLRGFASSWGGTDYSPVYDGAYYRDSHPDLKAAFSVRKPAGAVLFDDAALLRHFATQGVTEGRRASASFDVASYYNANTDVRAAFGTDARALAMHYLYNGRFEGRACADVPDLRGFASSWGGTDYSPVYDGAYYRDSHPDLKAAFSVRKPAGAVLFDDAALLRHFATQGVAEGRRASASFDVHAYRGNYPDLRAAFGGDLRAYYMHYITNGMREGRAAA